MNDSVQKLAYCTKMKFAVVALPIFASDPAQRKHVVPGRLLKKEWRPQVEKGSPFPGLRSESVNTDPADAMTYWNNNHVQ